MRKSILKLEAISEADNYFRTIFKNNHGRELYLSIRLENGSCNITRCFYTDRNRNKTGESRYSAKPKKLVTFQFPTDKLLTVIGNELDKTFSDVEYITSAGASLSLDEYIEAKNHFEHQPYRFLIFAGEGEAYNGLPIRLRTRLKNKLHRCIYLELEYYKNGKGVIRQCHYYDREYKRDGVTVTPPMLLSCFFPYTREGIISLVNCELCCDFTHMITTAEIDVDKNLTPICGSVFRR